MPSVLVVDDVTIMRDAMAAALDSVGYTVLEASTGRQALEVLERAHADLVIADIFMPDGDGFELIPKIRKNYPHSKVIAISGGGKFDAVEFLEIARELGANRTLVKPLLLRDLLTNVAELLSVPREQSVS